MWKKLRNPIFVFLFFIILAELLACYFWSDFWQAPPATEVNRNMKYKRGWPEYISGKPKENGKHVILIGTSQSFGEEIANDSFIYPSLARTALSNEFPDLTLENWSLGGIRTVDIEMLLMHAISKKPDLIVLALDASNFDRVRNRNLTFPNTDVNLLLTNPYIFNEMKYRSLLSEPLTEDIRISKIAERYSCFIRSRVAVHTELANSYKLNNEEQLFYFGKPITRGVIPDINAINNFRDVMMHRHRNTHYFKIEEDELREKYVAAKSFLTLLKHRLEGSNTKVIFTWIPLSEKKWEANEYAKIKRFRRVLHTWCQDSQIHDFDFLQSLHDSEFITVSHLKQSGHFRMANLLYPILKNELQ